MTERGKRKRATHTVVLTLETNIIVHLSNVKYLLASYLQPLQSHRSSFHVCFATIRVPGVHSTTPNCICSTHSD